MPTSHTLTGDLSDVVGTGFPRDSVWVTIKTNLGDNPVFDSAGEQIRFPRHRFALPRNAQFSKSLWSTAALTNPTGYQYGVEVEWPDGAGGTGKKRWFSGWFSLTADKDMSELDYGPMVPPEYYPELTVARDEAVAAKTDAEAAQAAAEAAQAAAEAVGNTNDTIMAGVASDSGSAFSSVLLASYGRGRVSALNGLFDVYDDGVTDSTSGLNAWASAQTADSIGVLPPGTYVTSGTLALPADRVFDLSGATILTSASGDALTLGEGTTILGSYNLTSTVPWTAVNSRVGIKVSNVSRFDLGSPTVDGFGADGIIINGCSHWRAGAVVVRNTGATDNGAGVPVGDGFWVTNGCTDFIIDSIECSDNGRHGLLIWRGSGLVAATNFAIGTVLACDNGDCGVQMTNINDWSIGVVTTLRNGNNPGPNGGQGFQVVGSAADYKLYGRGSIGALTAAENQENGVELHYVTTISIAAVVSRENTWSGLAVNNCYDITGAALNLSDNNTEGLSIVGTLGFTFTGVIAHRNNWDGVAVRNSSGNGTLIGVRANNNGQGGGTRCGVLVSGASGVLVLGARCSDDQVTKTQTYGVRFYSTTGGGIRDAAGTGNITRDIQLDGGAAGYFLDNPEATGIAKGRTEVDGVRTLSGTGSPEGTVTAPVGSIYRQSDGAIGNQEWRKTSGTGTTGWRPTGTLETTTAALAAVSDPVNTVGKFAGRPAWNTTTGRPVWAVGSAASAAWRFADGTTAHSPA